MSRECTPETFLKDVAKHNVEIMMDNGVYRHLKCSSGSWNQRFDVVTWPGYLAYTGDMGAFTFTRLDDMFQFFRGGKEDGNLYVNLGYWGEKLEAVDRDGRKSGFRKFSPEMLKERIEEGIQEWVEEYDDGKGFYECDDEEIAAAKKKFEEALREDIKDEIYLYLEDGEDEARRAVNDFSCTIEGKKYEFQDTWEWSCEEYTYRFVWCCYALAWAIQQYDRLKEGAKDEASIASCA